ncbi:YceD family protein [Thermovibrio sp.]
MKRKVNLSEITYKEPIKVKTTLQPSLLDLPKEEVSNSSPFELEVEISKKPVGYEVKGKVSGEVELTCSRCLKKFSKRINREFKYEIMPTSEISGGQIKTGELDVKFSDESILDLAEVVHEQVVLELPVKPLCSQECAEVSYEESAKEERDRRWEKLTELRDKLKEKEK